MTDLARRLALAGALLLLACPAQAFPQDPPKEPAPPTEEEKKKAEAEKKSEEVKTFLENYESTLSKMTDEDAIAGLGKMKAWYLDKSMPEDAKKAIVKCFGNKVIKVRGREPYLEAAAKTLGEMGDEDLVPMLQYIVDSAMKPKVPIFSVTRAGLMAMGKIASTRPSNLKFITDLLRGKDEFIADAARALSGYEKSSGAIRRDLVETLIKMSFSVWNASENSDSNAKKKWNTWGSDVIEAIEKLSRVKKANLGEYDRWLRDRDPGGFKHPKTWEDPPEEPKKEPKNGK
ncbi:MAG TPA: HEAT repeat domain-containing protein [Planctomycetota bacterium]|nr:HEAT repeat domain-containing protein [Planctomycetota bacterium]